MMSSKRSREEEEDNDGGSRFGTPGSSPGRITKQAAAKYLRRVVVATNNSAATPTPTSAAAATTTTTMTMNSARSSMTSSSLFALTLRKHGRALIEPYNQWFLNQIRNTVLPTTATTTISTTTTTTTTTTHAFWKLVAEYGRRMREVELRYLGEPGDLMCFGSNESFQQGLPGELKRDVQQAEPFLPHSVTSIGNSSDPNVRQVRTGGLHTAALTTDGHVYTFGAGDEGALGRPLPNGEESEATASRVTIVEGQGDNNDTLITQIDCGDTHILYLSMSGKVYMSGFYKDNDSGKFRFAPPGESIEGYNEAPVFVPQLKQVVAIYAGANFGVSLHTDRSIQTWGFGNCGELARSAAMTEPNEQDGSYTVTNALYRTPGGYDLDIVQRKFLTPLPPIYASGSQQKTVLNVACGLYHLMVAAMEPHGSSLVSLYTSGLNNYGQLGHGDTKDRHELTKVEFFKDGVGQLAAGEHFSMVLSEGGDALYAFGRNDYGSLGIGTIEDTAGEFHPTPRRVRMPRGVLMKQIAAGDRTSMAITIDHDLYTWGFAGTTGHGGEYDEKDCLAPRKLELPDNFGVFNVDGGGQHCAMVVGPKP